MSASTINVPNTITVARVVLALVALSILYTDGDTMKWISFGLTIVVIWADGLDGYFARKLNQSTKFGGILDIAGDRAVEMAYWIVFSSLHWVPVFVPLLYLVRGTFVDAIRSHVSEQGLTAFGKNTMMQSSVGKFLVASNFSRFTYAVVKAVAFCLVIVAQTHIGQGYAIPGIAMFCVYASCIFCLVRGLPVVFEAPAVFRHFQ